MICRFQSVPDESCLSRFHWLSLCSFLWNTQIYDTWEVIWYLTQYYGGWNSYVFFMGSFAEYLINEAAGVPRKSDGKSYFGKEIICAHQVEKVAKFFAFGNLQWIYIEITNNSCIRVFAYKYLHYRRELRHKLLYISIVIVVMRRPINVTNCECTTKVASVDINEQAFPDIWTGI